MTGWADMQTQRHLGPGQIPTKSIRWICLRLFLGFILVPHLGLATENPSLSKSPAWYPKKMVTIPAGELSLFWLVLKPDANAKNTAKPKVKISTFSMMPQQVTVGEFKSFLTVHERWQKGKVPELFADAAYLRQLIDRGLGDQTPITNVSWFAANAYCESLGMRLPSTLEWEYAAAASETKSDATDEPKFLQRILDWYSQPQGSALPKVGSIYQNLYQIWDLHGLVWEWVADFNSAMVTGESREDSSLDKNLYCGSEAASATNQEDYAAFMRFAFRSSLKGKSSIANLGFRCVK